MTGWWTSNPIKTHQLAFCYTAFSKALRVCVNCVLVQTKPSKPGISFPHCAPASPSLLIFPLCARPGHLYQSVRPTSKEKVSTVDGLAILVIHVMPGGLVGQGAEFSRSSCVLVKLTVRQPKRVSISLQNPSRPSLTLYRHAWLGARTYSNSHSTRNIRSLPLPPLNISQWLYREASITPDDIGWFFFPPPQPAHSSQRAGQGRGVAAVSALWLYHYRAADTVHQAQPVISILYFMMAKHKCAFVGSDQLDRPRASTAEFNSGMLFPRAPNLTLTLSYKNPSLIYCTINPHTHTCCDTLCPSYQILRRLCSRSK